MRVWLSCQASEVEILPQPLNNHVALDKLLKAQEHPLVQVKIRRGSEQKGTEPCL